MGVEKVIKLVIKIFTWFYQNWISKIKIKSANKIELRRILKRFNIRLRRNVKMQLRSFTAVIREHAHMKSDF